MKSDSSSRSGLLLMEIILAILFFSLISALCLQAFVKAHTLSQDTRKLDAAVRQADSVASVLLAVPEPVKKLQEIYPDSSMDGATGEIYFNQDFLPCGPREYSYRLDIVPADAGERTTSYSVTVYDHTAAEIYHVDVTAYRQYIP